MRRPALESVKASLVSEADAFAAGRAADAERSWAAAAVEASNRDTLVASHTGGGASQPAQKPVPAASAAAPAVAEAAAPVAAEPARAKPMADLFGDLDYGDLDSEPAAPPAASPVAHPVALAPASSSIMAEAEAPPEEDWEEEAC